MSENLILLMLCAAFLIAAIGLFFGGALGFIHARKFLGGAAKTSGVIVENAISKNSDDGTAYVPIVSFAAENGNRYTLTGKTATCPPIYDVGERVTVCYAPEHPENAKIYSVWEIYHNAFLFLFFVAAAFIAAAMLYYAAHH